MREPHPPQYAHAYPFVNNLGGTSWLNLWSPFVNTGTEQRFSLVRHGFVGGSGAGLQTVAQYEFQLSWELYAGSWWLFPCGLGV